MGSPAGHTSPGQDEHLRLLFSVQDSRLLRKILAGRPGASSLVPHSTTRWLSMAEPLPQPSPLAMTRLAARIYGLWTDGSLYALDPTGEQCIGWDACKKCPDSIAAGSTMTGVGNGLHILGSGSNPAHWRYDPGRNRWEKLPALPTPRERCAVGGFPQSLIVAGGCRPGGRRPQAQVDVFDLTAGAWSSLPRLPHPVYGAAAVTADERFWLFGGAGGGLLGFGVHPLKMLQIYSPATQSWSRGPDLPVAADGARIAETMGQIILSGGRTPSGDPLPPTRFDSHISRWQSLPAFLRARQNPYPVAIDGSLYMFGGASGAIGDRSGEMLSIAH